MEHKQILVVDDSAEVAFILGHIGRRAGWEIVNRRDSEQAVTCLAQQRPDLVLLDVNLPGANGFECCQWLRREPATADLVVAMFSQWHRAEDVVRALAAGADFGVSKELLARPIECRERLAEILAWTAGRARVVPVGWEGQSPTGALAARFNRAVSDTVAGRLGSDLLRALLDRSARLTGAGDWLPAGGVSLDPERIEGVLPETVAAFVTMFAEQCWRVLGSAASVPLWRAMGADVPAAVEYTSS